MGRRRNDASCQSNLNKLTSEEFDAFYEKHKDLVFRIAFHMVKDQQEAEDICHDIFLERWLYPEKYNPQKSSIESWLAMRTKCKSIDHLRKKNRVILQSDLLEHQVASNDTSPEENVITHSEHEELISALKKLPKEQQRAIYGSYFLWHTHAELANKLGKPIGTIKSLIRYGINNARKHIYRYQFDNSSARGGMKK